MKSLKLNWIALLTVLFFWNVNSSEAGTIKGDPVTSIITAVTIVARVNIRFTVEYFIPLDDASKNKDKFILQM